MVAAKHASTRARTNVVPGAATLMLGRSGPVPDLPDGVDWVDEVREAWVAWWQSPMAAEFHESDEHQLIVQAYLLQDFYAADSPTLRLEAAKELRLQRKDFGFTPYDRRRLQWTIASADDATDRRAARKASSVATPPAAVDDPRAALRAV